MLVNLPEDFTITSLGEVYQSLSDQVGVNEQIEINAKVVRRVDAAALQIVLALKNIPEVKVSWIGVSGAFEEAAELTGLSGLLGLAN